MSNNDTLETENESEHNTDEMDGEDLLRQLLDAKPGKAEQPVPPADPTGIVIGDLIAMTDEGQTPLVCYPGQPGTAALRARTTVNLYGKHIGKQVVLMFEANDLTKPIIMGILKETDAGWPLEQHPGQVEVDVDGERMTVAGVEMQFFTRFGSDTDDCLTVFLPREGVVLNNFLWPFVPNIYTLRGSKFRDPREWRDGLKVILGLDAEVLVNTHARAVRGRDAVRDTLEHVIDGLDLVLDQTLRGILRGCGPEELREFVRLPGPLATHPNLAEIYGEISHFGPYLYNHALGWFDGDAASINPLPPLEQATRLVEAMGGAAAVTANARRALDAKEYAWAAQLAGYLFRVAPSDPAIRSLKADALQAMGRVTPAHTIRNWYMAHARALRDGVRIHGCTVHFVRLEMDTGPIIAQAGVAVLPGDTPETLAARVLDAEHRLYPHALRLVASGAVRVTNDILETAPPTDTPAALFSPPLRP